MMRRTPHERVGPIGLEFDERELRAVQYARRGAGAEILGAVVLRREAQGVESAGGAPSEAELVRLRSVLDRRGFVGRDVALAVPGERCAFHILDLPPEESGAPIEELALVEVRRTGAHRCEDIQIGSWVLDRGRFSTRFACSVETGFVSDLADSIERVGFVVTRVSPPGIALLRAAVGHETLTPDAIHAIVGIGWASTRIVISLGATPVYMRAADRGFSHGFTPSARQNLIGDLASRIDAALAYVSQVHRTAPFGAVLCSGYLADEDELLGTVASRVAMPTNTLGRARQSESLDAIEPPERRAVSRLDTACGLALEFAA